ncbi:MULTISPECIES: DUF760 domain-containing protein [unclassified Synechococcus]|uniref:DUF760 domain-containing protein n=1 Tax=unclassified Synechococcus TaxID=2626047 RepID=UPI0039C370EB
MSSPINFIPGFEAVPTPSPNNRLWQYLQSQDPSVFQDIARNSSPEVLEILGYNIRSLLGSLPSDQFGVQIVTNRESLAKMLSGAMMGGYFLRVMEQRLALEQSLGNSPPAIDASQPSNNAEQPSPREGESAQ